LNARQSQNEKGVIDALRNWHGVLT
jgi:hypothetical protein